MKNIKSYYWRLLLLVFVISTSAKAQPAGPSETREQARKEIKAEHKKQRKRTTKEESEKKKTSRFWGKKQ